MSKDDELLFAMLSGQQNEIVIKRPFIRWLGYEDAALLSLFLEWGNNDIDTSIAWIASRTCLSQEAVLAGIERLSGMGLLTCGWHDNAFIEGARTDGNQLDLQLCTFLADEWASMEGDR